MEEIEEKSLEFHEMELDDRILKAIAKLGWIKPTLIQEKAIPILLEGKDLLIKARTGSGKTAAFAIPLIQKILSNKQMQTIQEIKGVIIAPSKELCTQICRVIVDLTVKCSREISVLDISPQIDSDTQKSLLIMHPDVVVTTPGRLLMHLKANNLFLKKSLTTLIIDEADLIFSFGYKEEIKSILNFLPLSYQAVLASATLDEDVTSLKKLILHNPAVLKLEEPMLAPPSQLVHYSLEAEKEDKAAILYALFKLHLIRGKTLIFVNTVDRCYKLKLFLTEFGIPACVLNSELPASSRCRAVNQFNNGVYDVIIASDEKFLEEPHMMSTKRGKRKKDKESGVARGIDFQNVSNVINLDFPQDIDSYIHRVGRTARGTNKGTALSFFNLEEKPRVEQVENELKQTYGQESLFKTYAFKLEEIEGFRYRAKDVWKAATRIAVRETRLKELKQEVMNCEKLRSYFEDNPKDLQALRQDKALHTLKLQPHLKNVPEYIVPPTLKKLIGLGNRKRKFNRANVGPTPSKSRHLARTSNPLISLSVLGNKKGK